jgi:hypothetical protein
MAGRALLLASLVAGVLPAVAGMNLSMDDPVTLEECDERMRRAPREYESYLCYWIASRRGDWQPAARRLDAVLQVDPANPGALLYRGLIDADHYGDRAEGMYRQAIAGFAGSGRMTGEFYARMALYSLLSHRGRDPEAGVELERILELAAASGDPEHVLGAGLVEAWATFREARYARAWALYATLAATYGEDAPSWLAYRLLAGQGQTAWALGRLEDALRYSRAAADLLHGVGNVYAEAIHRYYVAEIGWELAAAGRRSLQEARTLRREALDAALAGEHQGAEARARLLTARDPGLDLAARQAETRRALDLEEDVEGVEDICLALRLLAALQLEEDPAANLEEALDLLDRSIELSRDAGRPRGIAAGLAARAAASPEHRPRDEVVSDFLAAIDAVEAMRDLQWDRLVRARFLWRWTSAYYRLSAYLWDLPRGAYGAGDAELAFHTIERLRARIVTDLVDSRPLTQDPEGEPSSRVRRIALLQRQLLRADLSAPERAAALRELGHLEATASQARHDRVGSSLAAAMAPDAIPDLDSVRDSLRPGEVLISFQVPPWEGAGEYPTPPPKPWAVVVSPSRVTVVTLPEREALERSVDLFLGLLRRRDGTEADAARTLYRHLLGEAMASAGGLPEHLILVPDGALHRLPFGALRDASGRILAESLAISIVPSATLWHHWRTSPAGSSSSLLSVANPRLPGAGGLPATSRVGTVRRHLGPLPGAHAEARALLRRVGEGSLLLEGSEASEARLKAMDLGVFGVVHIAAHAIVDDLHPGRSALLLAPGASGEDGRLQVREIAGLRLGDSVVILSACSSATGEVTAGEGVVGLASAFFQAGARTVVAGLWPLEDREAEAIVTALGRELARGHGVARALALAQRERIDAGAPAAAWAGLVVLGEGALAPFPGARRHPAWLVPLGMLLALAAVLAAASWRRLPRPGVRTTGEGTPVRARGTPPRGSSRTTE